MARIDLVIAEWLLDCWPPTHNIAGGFVGFRTADCRQTNSSASLAIEHIAACKRVPQFEEDWKTTYWPENFMDRLKFI